MPAADSRAAARVVTTTGRIFSGLGLTGLGVTHFIFGAFTTGRAPAWPESLAGGSLLADLTGAAGVLVGIAVLVRFHVRLVALGWAVVVFGWAFLRQLPVVASDSLLGGSWTLAGKALVITGGLLALAAISDSESVGRDAMRRFINLRDPFIAVARGCLATFFLVTGMQHFKYIEFVASLIPTWFPGDAVAWTKIAGVMLLCGGIGLIARWTATLAALLSGLMVFSWFWIVHIPRTLTSVSDGIAVNEALLVSGIAFVIAGFRMGAEGERAPRSYASYLNR